MARERSTQFPLLGLLCIKPMAGYDLRCEIEKTLSFFWRESEGQIYPTLAQLEQTGHIVRVKSRTKSSRERQMFAITDLGRESLRAWIAEAPHAQSPRNEFLLKVFLLRYGPPGASLEHIRQHRKWAEERLAAAKELEKVVNENSSTYPDFPIWSTLFRYGIHMRRAEIAWCDETLRALHKFDRRAKQKTRKEGNL